jgi:hypothetical protein
MSEQTANVIDETADAISSVVYGIYRYAPMDERARLSLRRNIAFEMRAAVLAEREACAKVADETNQWIGDAIRARPAP